MRICTIRNLYSVTFGGHTWASLRTWHSGHIQVMDKITRYAMSSFDRRSLTGTPVLFSLVASPQHFKKFILKVLLGTSQLHWTAVSVHTYLQCGGATAVSPPPRCSASALRAGRHSSAGIEEASFDGVLFSQDPRFTMDSPVRQEQRERLSRFIGGLSVTSQFSVQPLFTHFRASYTVHSHKCQ